MAKNSDSLLVTFVSSTEIVTMSDPSPNRWSNLRDSFAAMREMLIVAAMLALLLTPTSVRSVLERAGIRSVAGVEFDTSTLNQSREELIAAQAQVDELRQELAITQQQFNQVAVSTGNTRNPKFTEVSELLTKSRRKLDATEGSLGRSRSMQDYLMHKFSGREPGAKDSARNHDVESSSPIDTSRDPSQRDPSPQPPSASSATAERVLMPPSEFFNR